MPIEAALHDVVRDAVRAVLREDLPRLLREAAPGPRTPGPRFLPIREAAKVAGVRPKTVRRWLKLGRLARHGTGRTILIEAEDLDRFLRNAWRTGRDNMTVDDVVQSMWNRAAR